MIDEVVAPKEKLSLKSIIPKVEVNLSEPSTFSYALKRAFFPTSMYEEIFLSSLMRLFPPPSLKPKEKCLPNLYPRSISISTPV